MNRNMELGVLIRGGTLPGMVARQFEAMIARGMLREGGGDVGKLDE